MAGGGRVRAEVTVARARKPRALWEEGMWEGASCLVRMHEGGGGPSSLVSDMARVPGSTWPGHQGMACHMGVG